MNLSSTIEGVAPHNIPCGITLILFYECLTKGPNSLRNRIPSSYVIGQYQILFVVFFKCFSANVLLQCRVK